MNGLKYNLSDAHVHFGECSLTKEVVTKSRLADFIEKNRIVTTLVFPLDLDVRVSNYRLIEAINTRYLSGAYVLYRMDLANLKANGLDPVFWTSSINRRCLGVKLHPSFDGVPVTDKAWDPLFDYLNKGERLVLIHCGRQMSVASSTHAIARARDNPGATFILAHMGGNSLDKSLETIKLAADLKNVYLDTSNCRTPYIIKVAVDTLGSERILLGSDYPWGSLMSNAYTIIDSNILDEDKENILSLNLENLIEAIRTREGKENILSFNLKNLVEVVIAREYKENILDLNLETLIEAVT